MLPRNFFMVFSSCHPKGAKTAAGLMIALHLSDVRAKEEENQKEPSHIERTVSILNCSH